MTIAELQKLAGIDHNKKTTAEQNISYAGTEKARVMRKKKIKPGTEEWFKLWFSRPYLTGEKPY